MEEPRRTSEGLMRHAQIVRRNAETGRCYCAESSQYVHKIVEPGTYAKRAERPSYARRNSETSRERHGIGDSGPNERGDKSKNNDRGHDHKRENNADGEPEKRFQASYSKAGFCAGFVFLGRSARASLVKYLKAPLRPKKATNVYGHQSIS